MRTGWNIFVVSNTTGNRYRFYLGSRALSVIAGGLVIVTVVSSLVLTAIWAKTLKKDNARLRERLESETDTRTVEMERYESELQSLNKQFEELLTLESQLREVAGVDLLEATQTQSKMGGQGGRAENRVMTIYPDNGLYQDTVVTDKNLSGEALLRDATITKDRLIELLNTLQTEEKRLAGLPSINPVDCPDAWISSGFGYRKDPITHRKRFHEGLDIVAWRGTHIIAPADGRVTTASWRPGLGRTVEINHGYGYRTTYGHNGKLLVKKGDYVKRGDVIALLGNSGRSTGPHLHYEIRFHGKLINPYWYVKR